MKNHELKNRESKQRYKRHNQNFVHKNDHPYLHRAFLQLRSMIQSQVKSIVDFAL